MDGNWSDHPSNVSWLIVGSLATAIFMFPVTPIATKFPKYQVRPGLGPKSMFQVREKSLSSYATSLVCFPADCFGKFTEIHFTPTR